MSVRRHELALTRQRLLERSSVLRERVAIQSAALTPALEIGDRVRDLAYWARTHPALVVSVVVVVAVVRPRTTWRWTLRVWSVWKFVQRWRILLAPLGNAS